MGSDADMEDYGFEYSEEEPEEQDVDIENQYYNSKGLVETDPEGALTGFAEVVEMEPEKADWGFKALKQTVKLHYRLGRYKEMMEAYRVMLTYIKSAVTRNYSEKCINNIMDFVSGSASQNFGLLQEFYQTTLKALEEAKNERLWFKTNLKLCKIWFDMGEYGRMNKILKELHKSCQKSDGSDDQKKGTQLLEVYAIEIQMYTETKNNKKLKQLYQKALTIKSAIPHPRIMGIIHECGGKMHMAERQWAEAATDFFEAFKNYDEAGNQRRIQCLKYLVLANMLMESEVNPFDGQEAKPYVVSGDPFSDQNMEAGRQVFSVDLLERYAAKGHGVITCMAAGNDVIVLGTSKGWVIRHDFGVGQSSDIDLSAGAGRPGEQSIHRVFVDPGGSHCITTVVGSGGADTFYTHAKWTKPRVLNKLKGLVVNAVAWNRQQITEASTREVILGTDNGQLHEIAVDEKDKREKYIKFLFELKELPEAFTDLQMETSSISNGTRYYVMAVTPTRLYSFTGIGLLDTVFESYLDRAVHFMELPGDIPNSELQFFIKQRRSIHFAWLSGAGIYYGGLKFGAQHSSPNGDENFVENKALFDYSKLSEAAGAAKPSSLAVSEFHFLLLIGNKVKVVNRISEQIVEELNFDQTSQSASRGILGLCSDASAGLFYAYDQNSIFQVSVNDEGRDMWKVYLDLKEYAAALANCRDPFQRDQVYLEQAEVAFSAKDFVRAASFYAKINYILSFEEISLKFISIGEQDSLRTFLLRKMDNLAKDDKCQITMISTWTTELYLDKINRLLLEDDTASESRSSEYQLIIKEFRAFLSDSKDVLDEATTMKLLESYGRVDELVYFANLKEQYEIVIQHYIQQGEAKKALEVLQQPAVPLDLQYKFAPDLIMLDAYETVESWMITKNLNPRKMIPAMMRYSSELRAKNETHEVIKYLEFCVHRLQNEDPGAHNLLLSLYTKQEDESSLLRFLQCKFGKGRPNGPDFFYDPKYALRLCLKEKRMRACVHIYSMMSMHEEAVALALQVDPELAMAEADKIEDDEDLRKKLWLMVAKHVVEQEKGTKRENIRKAIAFLKETDGLLKIEDILPFFPDFALIDDFKEAICSSLEDYNHQIEKLKEEMNDATQGADNIRNDIIALAQRYAVIERDEECGVCRRKILSVGGDYHMVRGYTSVGPMAPFYVFPCGHAFHAQCLITHVTRCTDQSQAERILDLQKQLTLLGSEPKENINGGLTRNEAITSMMTPVDKIRSQLDDAIASECSFCGDLMIREISLPFILPEEAHQVSSWVIKPQALGSQKSLSLIV